MHFFYYNYVNYIDIELIPMHISCRGLGKTL